MNDGYSICLNRWALDENIKNELRLLLIISSLTAEKGYCYASNKYLAEQFNETEQSISNKIKKLEKNNYIEVEYEKRGCEIKSRSIRLKNFYTHDIKNFISTIEKDFKENNISINNISNNIKENIKRKFEKPLLEEIKLYCDERKNGINPNTFYDFYESKDWMVGKNKMKNWKACIRTWEQRQPKKTIPEWFDKDIKSEQIDDTDFQDFIEEFRK